MKVSLVEGAGRGFQCPDLRRRRERGAIERLLEWAVFLPRRDELLLRAVLEDGRRVAEVAGAAGVCPRVLRRRVRRLVERVTSPRFAFVATRMGDWTTTRRKVAESCYLHGLAMSETGRLHRLSRHQVRFHREAVETLFQMEVVRLEKSAGGRRHGARGCPREAA